MPARMKHACAAARAAETFAVDSLTSAWHPAERAGEGAPAFGREATAWNPEEFEVL